jgi:4-amino-4-deoxy-L-arabinose transferase-like glycosyltransferase
VIAALAALSYAWGINHATLETFYGAAVRSMSQSWHNFFFGSFDPWGTVTVDKLPGAFWVQALSVRLFGFHVWSVALPQAAEGVLTVLVLYRAVRRVAGAGAGLAAAAVLAATPVTILLNRGNISDSLLILLLVLAADATTAALTTGRLAQLLLAGMWVGLAFQAKMLQAWLVLPPLYLAYVLAAPAPALTRRLGHVALSALVALGVSLSWMLVVTVVPAHDRPYVDGSCNDSVFSQVFLYNGADRLTGHTLDQPGCSPRPAPVTGTPSAHPGTVAVPQGPGRFLNGAFGTDGDWMLVPAAVALAGILVARRREPRTDPPRAAALLWATWLVFTWCFFASSHSLNSYYLAALAPPIAALCGMGLALGWQLRALRATRAVVLGTVAAGTAYVLYLLPASAGVRPWVEASTLALALAAVVVTGCSFLSSRPRWTIGAGVGLSAAALFLGSAWASGTIVAAELGPFDSPYQPAALTARNAADDARSAVVAAELNRAAARVAPTVSVLTSETSSGSSIPILDTGREFLPVGGFTGRAPSPTLAQFVSDVRAGRIVVVLAAVEPRTRNPDMLWAIAHCRPLRYSGPDSHIAGRTMHFYACSPADAG